MTSPRRFRKKPVEIQAIHYDGTNADAVAEFMSAGRGGLVVVGHYEWRPETPRQRRRRVGLRWWRR